MKTGFYPSFGFQRGLACSVFIATLLSQLCLADEAKPIVIYPASQGRVEAANGFVELGYRCDTVLFALGDPTAKLNENLWVYRGFQCNLREASRLDTLVLQFENQRLVAFKFVDEKTLKASVVYFKRQLQGSSSHGESPGDRQPIAPM